MSPFPVDKKVVRTSVPQMNGDIIVALARWLRWATRVLELRGPTVLSGGTWGPTAKAAFRRMVLLVKFDCVVATHLYTRRQEPGYL